MKLQDESNMIKVAMNAMCSMGLQSVRSPPHRHLKVSRPTDSSPQRHHVAVEAEVAVASADLLSCQYFPVCTCSFRMKSTWSRLQ